MFLPEKFPFFFFAAYTTFFIMGLLMSMQVPFVGFQPIRTSEHMAAAGFFPNLMCMKTAQTFDILGLDFCE